MENAQLEIDYAEWWDYTLYYKLCQKVKKGEYFTKLSLCIKRYFILCLITQLLIQTHGLNLYRAEV